MRKKRKISEPVLWQKPSNYKKMKVKTQHKDATKNFDYTTNYVSFNMNSNRKILRTISGQHFRLLIQSRIYTVLDIDGKETKFPFLKINIPSSPAYGIFISQLIRYTKACPSYECFYSLAVRLPDKIRDMSWNVWNSLEGRSMVGKKILSNNMKSPFPNFYTTFWRMTICIETLHWSDITPIFDPVTELDFWQYQIWPFT